MEYKAFRDLTKEERSEIVEAWLNGTAEELITGCSPTKSWGYLNHTYQLSATAIYRIKPAKKLDIPWEIIKPEYKWAAMQPNGCIHVYTKQPCSNSQQWCVVCSMDKLPNIARIDLLIPIDTTGISWENSLTQRPEGI